MRHPYTPPLTAEEVEARKTMPLHQGFIIALTSLDHPREEYIQAWREWCRQTPKRMWPTWIERWAAIQKLRNR